MDRSQSGYEPYQPVEALCEDCGRPVRPYEANTWRRVEAYEQLGRNGRPSGRLTRKVYTGQALCSLCGRDEVPQGVLFE